MTSQELDNFKWESQDQKESFLASVKWLRDHGFDPEQIRPIDLLFMQLEHDSYEHWRTVFAIQVKSLQDTIHSMHNDLNNVRAELYSIKARLSDPTG